jgi:FMN-dependent oxidoreductase (nitrilotriacetate monooxygenase family)
MPERSDQEMHLFLFFAPVGRNRSSWRRPTSGVEMLYGLEGAAASVQRAEAAKMDAVFFADQLFFVDAGVNPWMGAYEPLTTMAALSAVTEHIGLVATISTTFSEPYNVARMLSQLDHLSNGRVGWNVVTSYDGAQNFTVPLPEKQERYLRAEDYLQACIAVWDAWEDDAVIVDRENGVWADPAKIHQPNYRGDHYQIRDALSIPRSPQGRPVIAQAGQSAEGMRFAARNAEVVFTAQVEKVPAQQFRSTLAELSAEVGRGRIPILPGLMPVLGDTQEEAERILAELGDLVQPDIALATLSGLLLGADLTGLDLDRPVPPDLLIDPAEAATHPSPLASRYPGLYRIVVDEKPTLRTLLRTHGTSSGHQVLVGTAQTVAERMEEWFRSGACDGFTLTPSYMPEGLDRICDDLIPELQRRGLFRREYPGTTLRDTLGLARPATP